MVGQFEFLRVLCGFCFASFTVKGSCSGANQRTLTAKYAKKGRKVREEIQIEPLLGQQRIMR
jgi:hypothetical protein